MNDEKKAELIKFIQNELCYAYCDNCRGNEEQQFEGCEDCHRKYIGWEVGLPTATRIAEKAAQILSEEVSDTGLLEMLERSLHLYYDHAYVQNGVVYHNAYNNQNVLTAIKTDLPEAVYSAYGTIRKYLLNKEANGK